MTLKEALEQLKALGNEKARAHNTKHGAGDNQFGVKLGDIRKLAKKIKADHELALPLWETGNVDAQLLAILLIKPKNLSAEEVDRMVRSVTFVAWRTGSTPTSSSSTPTRRRCARSGWPRTTAGRRAPDGT